MVASSVGPGRGPRVGVLALQGDVREHLRMLSICGADAIKVRRPEELAHVDGLILPGGESTTMAKLARTFGLLDPLREAVRAGLPMFGTCAGMILLSDRILDGAEGQETIGGLDVTVRRNAFGRQVDSFEADLEFEHLPTPFHAVFIRAPWIEEVGKDVSVLSRVPIRDTYGIQTDVTAVGRVVAVRDQNLLATSFHPEMAGDSRLHSYFVRDVVTS